MSKRATTHQSSGDEQLGPPPAANLENATAARYHARPQADVTETGHNLYQ